MSTTELFAGTYTDTAMSGLFSRTAVKVVRADLHFLHKPQDNTRYYNYAL